MSRFVRKREVLARVGCSQATLWRWVKLGLFPVSHQIGPGSVAWLEEDIDKWIADRLSRSPVVSFASPQGRAARSAALRSPGRKQLAAFDAANEVFH